MTYCAIILLAYFPIASGRYSYTTRSIKQLFPSQGKRNLANTSTVVLNRHITIAFKTDDDDDDDDDDVDPL